MTSVSSSTTIQRLWIENIGSYEAIGLGELSDYFLQPITDFSKYNFICYDCTTDQEGISVAAGPQFSLVNRKAHAVKWYRGALALHGGPTVNNNIGFDCVTTAGCVFDIQDAFMDFTTGGGAGDTGNIPINCAVSCTVKVENSVIKGNSTAYADVAGSKLFDLGGNTWGPITAISGTVIGPTNSARGTACATGNFALTSGWGTSSVTSVAANGDIQGCHVTVTGAAGAAGPVLTWTYPVAPIVAPSSCHLIGTTASLTGVQVGVPGATTVAFTFVGTPTTVTYQFDVGCP